jgi:hypothetical protein
MKEHLQLVGHGLFNSQPPRVMIGGPSLQKICQRLRQGVLVSR